MPFYFMPQNAFQAASVVPSDLFNATSSTSFFFLNSLLQGFRDDIPGHASFVRDKWWQLVGDMMVQVIL